VPDKTTATRLARRAATDSWLQLSKDMVGISVGHRMSRLSLHKKVEAVYELSPLFLFIALGLAGLEGSCEYIE
jgi:hypothetical protein